jgi:AraC-like DNA-binding protein
MARRTKDEVFSYDRVERRRKRTGVHFHEDYELYYLLNGETNYSVGDELYRLRPGDLMFVPKGVLHYTDSETCLHNERLLVTFGDEIVDETFSAVLEEWHREKCVHIPSSKRRQIDAIFQKIEEEYGENRPFRDAMLKTHIRELLTTALRLKTRAGNGAGEADTGLHDVLAYITSHFAEELSLSGLSKRFAVSEAHLSRTFKARFGMGVCEHITYIRMLRAEQLLSGTSLSVTQVAEAVGFHDSNYFSTVFKKVVGVTPLRYRREKTE